MIRRVLAVGLVVALVALLVVAFGNRPSGGNASATAQPAGVPFSIAVIGDVPYTEFQLKNFPQLTEQIDADPDIELVAHLGDIKNSASPCTVAYFRRIRAEFDRFDDPLVYTPGDNEWTDCSKP